MVKKCKMKIQKCAFSAIFDMYVKCTIPMNYIMKFLIKSRMRYKVCIDGV